MTEILMLTVVTYFWNIFSRKEIKCSSGKLKFCGLPTLPWPARLSRYLQAICSPQELIPNNFILQD